MKQLQVIATMLAKAGEEAKVRQLLIPAVVAFRSEPGCSSYVLLEDNRKAGCFITYETWHDDAALAAHMKSPAMAELEPQLVPLLRAPIQQDFLSLLVQA
jgi:quinol monooxygenase YgiN